MSPQVLHILLALAEGPKHGYAIMEEVSERTGGAVDLGPGTLYGAFKRMLGDGWIVESGTPEGEEPSDRRKYYRITLGGRDAAASALADMEKIVRMGRERRVIGDAGEA